MTGRKDLFDESMRLGHSAAWELDWDRSIEFYRKAVAEFPDDSTALISLGLALIKNKRYREALDIYKRAAEVSPSDPIPFEKCAEIHEQRGEISMAIERREAAADLHVRRRNTEKAIENWGQIARMAPDNLSVRSRLALTYERLGRRQEASREYLAVASILQKSNKINRAMEAAQLALRLTPGDKEASDSLRSLRQGKALPNPRPPHGHTGPLRISEMESYIKSSPVREEPEESDQLEDPEASAQNHALSILAGILFEEPQSESRGKEMMNLSSSEKEQGPLSQLRQSVGRQEKYRLLSHAIDLQTRRNPRQAAEELQRAIDNGLDHPAAHYNLGILLKELHDNENARLHLMASIGHPELALGSNLALGRLSRQEGDMAEAARFLLQALRFADSLSVDKDQSAQLNNLYDTIMASQTEGDDKVLSQIVENTLNFLSGPQWLHRVKMARKQLEDQGPGATVIPIAEILSVGSTDRIVRSIEKIDTLIAANHFNSAMDEAMLALDYAPYYLGLHLRIANILIETNHKDVGLKKLVIIAETHCVRGETIQAAKVYRRILHLSPISLDVRKRLINLLAQQDLVDDAVQQHLELADLYRQMANMESARDTLTEGLKLARRSSNEHKLSIELLRQIGDLDCSHLDWNRALRVYEQILKLDPADEIAPRHVIDLSLRLGKDTQAADELDKYLEHLVKADQGKEALTLLEELVHENPGKQVLHARLADAYRAVGRKADAIAQYDALGEIQLNAGQIKGAIHSIGIIIEIGPPEIDVTGYRDLLHNLEVGQ